MAKHSTSTTRKKRVKKGLAIVLVAFLAILGVLSTAVGVVWWKLGLDDFQHDPSLDDKTDQQLGISDTTLTKEVVNIALFGIDSRNATGTKGNSDSIMIISIDQVHSKIKVISVMRDTLVYVPPTDSSRGYYCKINSVYAKGGPEKAVFVLNTVFNLNIRHYATVNFVGMVDIIDSLGGIEVDVTEAERQDANIHIKWMAWEVGTANDPIRRAGKQVLNGVQAVCWARVRHVSTADGVNDDYGRTDRQRYVMEKLFEKAMNAGVAQYPAMIKALLPYVQTSLDYGDIFSLAGTLVGGTTFEQTRVPLKEYVINGGYYEATGSSTVYYNLNYAGRVIHSFIYDDIKPEDFMEQNGIDKTPWVS